MQKVITLSVEGPSGTCQSDSLDCETYTRLRLKCELFMRDFDRGLGTNSPYRGYCGQAETFRENATGIGLSTAPGAMDF